MPHASPLIHPTAIVHDTVELAAGVQIGPYAVIGPDVRLGAGAVVGPHAVVEHADVGAGCRLHAGSFVGTAPQDLKYKGEKTRAVLGDGTVVRECVTVNRGTEAAGTTSVGKNCLLMAYTHLGHDCVVGDNVIMANAATLAGHVEIADDVVIGGLAAIHQFTRVGVGAMLGGGAMVAADVAPFCMVQGDRATVAGLNVVGLRRRGLSRESSSALKSAFRIVFQSGLSLQDAVARIDAAGEPTPEVRLFVDFLRKPSRGLMRPSPRAAAKAEPD